MGKRCGCTGDCHCVYAPGRGLAISGLGVDGNPYEISATAEAAAIILSRDTPSVVTDLQGRGSAGDPYVFSATRTSQSRVSRSVYLEPGVHEWTPPGQDCFVNVVCIGGGQGGYSGVSAPDASLPWSEGGVGGAGGGRSSAYFWLPANTNRGVVIVGPGGKGGLPNPQSSLIHSTPGGAGGYSTVRFFDPNNNPLGRLGASGGINFSLDAASQPWGQHRGQESPGGGLVPAWRFPSATAGGRGERNAASGAFLARGEGGVQEPVQPLTTSMALGLGGHGGVGGISGIVGAAGKPGAPGQIPGGGGGGGGGSGAYAYGGSGYGSAGRGGGSGGDGAAGGVWITIL